MDEARNAMHDLMMGATKSYITYTVAKLDIVDYLSEKPMTAEELAIITSTKKDILYRLLRAAVEIGLVVENEVKQFLVTDLGSTLKTGGKYSMKNMVMFRSVLTPHPASKLPELLKAERNGFNHKKSFFEMAETQPEVRKYLHGSITEYNERIYTDLLISGYDYSKYKHIIDVGGGSGTFLIDILTKTPSSCGKILDLPSIIESAKKRIEKSTVNERCTAEVADFFTSVPDDGDCYILKFILHDWNDVNALKILRTIRKSMKNGSKLLVMELIKSDGNDAHAIDVLDIWMFSLFLGKERTKSEFEQLFETASLKIENVVEISPCPVKIIEVNIA
ncbi:hypothetical protein B4U80_13322 [Leptotrombidium deliense]|uniref:Acetylserotonin O-methyltransferase n=1 Tax=Leptotrombidium deliense TaxID=299467 RepID=A0A443S878_9ACAR|nr:hypothetical protein B4U80_13322 [Leptotrombidium deliense]